MSHATGGATTARDPIGTAALGATDATARDATDAAAQDATGAAALDVTGLCKSFRAVQALDDVALRLHYGQVTALLGDNGAGKSTLVKCISGVHAPDAGVIRIDGSETVLTSPDAARALGIETVHQTLAVIDTLDVAANLFLNRELTRGGRVGAWLGMLDHRRMRTRSQEILERLGIRIPSLRHPMGALSGGQRQAVAIGRATVWGQRIVLLDEPAAALGVEQTARVLDLIRSLRDAGAAVLLVTHNMDRVSKVCDRAVVLRQGRKTAEVRVAEVTSDDLVAYITGARADAAVA